MGTPPASNSSAGTDTTEGWLRAPLSPFPHMTLPLGRAPKDLVQSRGVTSASPEQGQAPQAACPLHVFDEKLVPPVPCKKGTAAHPVSATLKVWRLIQEILR